QYHVRMGSSPRYTRGTSVIAALVFAAILGAVALSLNALQPGPSNTVALSAQASAAAPATASPNQYDQICKDGLDFDDTLPQTVDNSNVEAGISDFADIPLQEKQIQVCMNNQQATAEIVNNQFKNVPATKLPPTYTSSQDPILALSKTRVACSSGNDGASQTTKPALCTYDKQSDGTYKLRDWTCNVRLNNPGMAATNSNLQCQLYYSKP